MIINYVNESLRNQLLGIYAGDPDILAEHQEVIGFYNFYEGKAKTENDLLNEVTAGQSWLVPPGLDYKPSQDIRNHAKKLIKKQARFMLSVPPTIISKPRDKKNKDAAEGKKQFLEEILDETEFWNDAYKAFLDSTIGKRVLLVANANPGEEISFKFYTMPEFTFEVDPNNYKKLIQVIIAYQDSETEGKVLEEQVWHRWKYYMNEQTGTAWFDYGQFDGRGRLIEGTEEVKDTKLDELPCRVITNGGLTGEIEGKSDLADLIDLANAYNRTMSDFRDALRFKMFEQPVFTDADPQSVEAVKVAPNALIDLKTDPASGEGKQAKADMLSSTFNFVEAAETYLELTKADMYELMDQPRPEDIKNVPSGKAFKMLFYDLMARCEEKWNDWEPVVLWTLNFIVKATKQFSLYNGYEGRQYLETDARLMLRHNYPIPEDEAEQKKTALEEVKGNTKSIRTYIREFGDVLDEDQEFKEIIEEIKALSEAEADSFNTQLEEGLDDEGNLNNKQGQQGNPKGGTNPDEE